jgi:hypothetical protein
LARSIELSVPDYAVVEVPRELISAIPYETARRVLANNVGLNFGSVYLPGRTSWYPALAPPGGTFPDGLDEVLTFDATVINGDRKAGNSNLLWDGRDFNMIDHSVALPMPLWSDSQIAQSPLFPEQQVRDHCAFPVLSGKGAGFETRLDHWVGNIGSSELATLRSHIPKSWEEKRGDLDRIFQFLACRPNRFKQIQANLRRIVR